MSITAYKIEAVGHDRIGKDFGYVNIMYRYGNKQSCPRPDQCEIIILHENDMPFIDFVICDRIGSLL